mmetsp:Transcript_24291/g.36002  ORF Transcript_24291/g.36002 Transcript_24291/m.36002 type:complete len:664 (+) Transcript_24291:116-2107(+)
MRQKFLTIVSVLLYVLYFDVSLAVTNVTMPKDISSSAVITKSENHTTLERGAGTTNLPLQDVNILILTNFHSWVGDYGLQPTNRNADYGDVLSFYRQLEILVGNNRDLWFVMNGNFGHSSVIGGQYSLTASAGILERIPYDLVTIGNQEFQSPRTVQFLKQPGALVDWWGGKLLTSNIGLTSTNKGPKPLGSYYKYLKGGTSTILAFGFLCEMTFIKSLGPQLFLQRAENTIELPWFKEVLQRGDFDIVLVLGQVDVQLERKILKKIRAICGKDMLVQFITGHNSTRGFSQLDSNAPSMETGHLLNTLGFVSFDKTKKQFHHTFINTTNKNFAATIGMTDYMTDDGFALRDFMNRTEISAGGNEILGCSPKRFRANGLLTDDDSLLRLYLYHILPDGILQLYKKGSRYNNILLQSINSFVRNDLLPGTITMNDLWGIIPHDDTIRKIAHSLRGDKIIRIGELWSEGKTVLNGTTPSHTYAVDADLRPGTTYDLFALSGEASQLGEILKIQKVYPLLDELLENDGSSIMMRDIWINFVKKNWPYDGKQCSTAKKNEPFHKDNIFQNEVGAGPRTSKFYKGKTDEKHPFASFFAFFVVVAAILFLRRKYFMSTWEGQHHVVNGTTGASSFAPNDLELKPMGIGNKGYQDVPDSYQSHNTSVVVQL